MIIKKGWHWLCGAGVPTNNTTLQLENIEKELSQGDPLYADYLKSKKEFQTVRLQKRKIVYGVFSLGLLALVMCAALLMNVKPDLVAQKSIGFTLDKTSHFLITLTNIFLFTHGYHKVKLMATKRFTKKPAIVISTLLAIGVMIGLLLAINVINDFLMSGFEAKTQWWNINPSLWFLMAEFYIISASFAYTCWFIWMRKKHFSNEHYMLMREKEENLFREKTKEERRVLEEHQILTEHVNASLKDRSSSEEAEPVKRVTRRL